MTHWWLPFKRGADGLTWRQRRRHAQAYAHGAGRTPEPSQDRLERLLAEVRSRGMRRYWPVRIEEKRP